MSIPSRSSSAEGCKELLQLTHIAILVDGRIRTDPETFLFGPPDRLQGLFEHAGAAGDAVVGLPHAIQVDVEGECRVGLKLFNERFAQDAVGAQVDVPFQAEELREKGLKVFVEKGLAPGNGDNRRA